jgi:hypothetical protein
LCATIAAQICYAGAGAAITTDTIGIDPDARFCVMILASTTRTLLSVTPWIIMVYPLTYFHPTITHSDITTAGVVDAKVKSIGSCTGSHTVSHNGI